MISTVSEQIARELVTPGGRPVHGIEERVIRVSFHCNQACDFCFVSTHLPPPEEDAVLRAIQDALDAGTRIALSGGEPTLNPRLPMYMKLASQSPHTVELQTNATRLEDIGLAQKLYDAGLRQAFVSLHGATAAICDAVTRAPGTFVKTIRGVDNLHKLGVSTRLNYVLCRTNAHELPEMVDMVADRWPGFGVTVSFVARSSDVVTRDVEFMPRYSQVMPFILDALARGERRGVTMGGFQSMCGLPLCLVPQFAAQHFKLPVLKPGEDGGEFEKPDPCQACALNDRCFGVRRGYVDTHGHGELVPFTLR